MPAEPQRCAHPRGKGGGDPQRAPPERRQSHTGSPRVAAALPAALTARGCDARGRGNARRFFRLSSRRDVRRRAAHPQPPRAATGERARAEERQRREAATGAAPRGALTRPCLGAAYLWRRGAARRAAAASAAARPGAAAGPRGAPPWGRGAAGRGAAARPASVSAGLPRSFLRAPPSPPPGLPGHCSGAAPRRRASALRPPPALAPAPAPVLGPSRPAPGACGLPDASFSHPQVGAHASRLHPKEIRSAVAFVNRSSARGN